MSTVVVSANLANIVQWNGGITIPDDALKKIQANQIRLVGRGSLAVPGVPTSPSKGCIEWAFYNPDLERIKIDGVWYSPDNIRDYAETIKCAWQAKVCINFCLDSQTNTMFMLNVYPQCCCVCEEVRD